MDEFKISAIFRQSWYEAAKTFLPEKERLMFYEVCLDYAFTGKEPTHESVTPAVGALWMSCKPIIDADRQKAINVINRNRTNGRAGGRPSLQSNSNAQEETNPKNPVGNLGSFGSAYTNTYTHKETNTNTFVCVPNARDTNTQKFLVCLIFFRACATNAVAEASKFWNYYEARGWEVPGGGKVRDIVALARAWRISDTLMTAKREREMYGALLEKIVQAIEEPPFYLIQDFDSLLTNRAEKTVTLRFYGERAHTYIEEKAAEVRDLWFSETFPKSWALSYTLHPIIA